MFLYPVSLDLSIVLVSYRRKEQLFGCLRDIAAQACNFNYEVILVLQGYEKAIQDEILYCFGSKLRIVLLNYEQGLGLVKARNIGLVQARGAVIGFLDDDIRLNSDWIEQILRRYNDEHIGGVGGYIIHASGYSKISQLVFQLLGLDPPIYMIDRLGFPIHPINNHQSFDQETMWLPGGACTYRRTVFESVGCLEERFIYGYEDSDFSIRVRRAGWKLILTPDATVTHLASPVNRNSYLGSIYQAEYARVLAVRKALVGVRFWRLYYWCGFTKMLFIWILSGVLHRNIHAPLSAIKGALAGIRDFGPKNFLLI